MITRYFIFFLLIASSLFGADAANDVIITQRNSGNTGNVQRNLAGTANSLMGFDGSSVAKTITAGSGITIVGGVISSTAAGTGTVTTIPDGSTNGVTWTVATRTTTPTFTFSLGAIVPTTVNGNTITTGTGTLTLGSVTLNAGPGGTLGTAAFTAASAYEVALTFSTGLTRTVNTITANAVNLAASGSGGVTGRLPFANLTQGSALSVLGVGGNSTADVAAIVASADGQVLRRQGTNIGFGTVDLASTFAVSGNLSVNNLNSGSGASSTTYWAGDGTWKSITGFGSVTTTGTMTANALVTSNGTTVIKTINGSSTLDASGFMTLGGGITAPLFGSTSNTGILTSKANFHVTELSILDYGATTASGDNTTAINAAITACPTGGTVIIPEGIYQFSGTIAVTGKTGITIKGLGWGAVLKKTSNFGSVGLAVGTGSTYVTLRDFKITTTCTVRSGGHLVVLNGDGNCAINLWNEKSPEFAFFCATSASDISNNVRLIDCLCTDSFADGFHYGAVRHGAIMNCICRDSADDSFAVAADVGSNASYFSDDVMVEGCKSYNSGSRGIIVEDSNNVTVQSCYVYGSASSGIWVTAYNSLTWFNQNIRLVGNVLEQVIPNSLGRAGIMVAYTHGITISGGSITNAAGSLINNIFLCDVSQATVTGVFCYNPGSHGITAYGDTSSGPGDIGIAGRTFSTTWDDWSITGCTMNTNANSSGYAIYMVGPPSLVTINRLLVTANECSNYANTNYIAYAHCTTGKIINNVGLGSTGIIDGGGNTSMTVTPNY